MTKDDLLEFIANETYDEKIDLRIMWGKYIGTSLAVDKPELKEKFTQRKDLYQKAFKDAKGVKMLTQDLYCLYIYEEFKKTFFSE